MRDNDSRARKPEFSGRTFVRYGAVVLSALLLVVGGCARPGDDRITTSTEAPPALNHREARALSLAATKVLHETNLARRALRGETPAPQEALLRIERGLTLVHIIQNTVPWTKVKTEIKAGTLVYRGDEADGGTFIPISDSLVEFDALIPERRGTAGGDPGVVPAANLKLAEYEISENHVDVAAVNLKAAGESLEAYELSDGRHADEARQMHMDIETLVTSLGDATGSTQGRVEVEEEIARWWKAIASWLGPMD